MIVPGIEPSRAEHTVLAERPTKPNSHNYQIRINLINTLTENRTQIYVL